MKKLMQTTMNNAGEALNMRRNAQPKPSRVTGMFAHKIARIIAISGNYNIMSPNGIGV